MQKLRLLQNSRHSNSGKLIVKPHNLATTAQSLSSHRQKQGYGECVGGGDEGVGVYVRAVIARNYTGLFERNPADYATQQSGRPYY
jgi:hypothetical protein